MEIPILKYIESFFITIKQDNALFINWNDLAFFDLVKDKFNRIISINSSIPANILIETGKIKEVLSTLRKENINFALINIEEDGFEENVEELYNILDSPSLILFDINVEAYNKRLEEKLKEFFEIIAMFSDLNMNPINERTREFYLIARRR